MFSNTFIIINIIKYNTMIYIYKKVSHNNKSKKMIRLVIKKIIIII